MTGPVLTCPTPDPHLDSIRYVSRLKAEFLELDQMILKRGEVYQGDQALAMFLNLMDSKV